MAQVNIDLSEYDAVRNRVKELEELVKEQKETIKSLKDGSRVIVRREQVIEFEQPRSAYDEFFRKEQPIYNSTRNSVRPSRPQSNTSTLSKVEEHYKDEVQRSIKQRDDARDSYEKLSEKVKDKFQKKELALQKEYDQKHTDLNKEFSAKEAELNKQTEIKQAELEKKYNEEENQLHKEIENLDNQVRFRLNQYEIMFKSFDNIKYQLEKDVKLYDSKRFFKPKGVDIILDKVIGTCNDIIQKNKGR